MGKKRSLTQALDSFELTRGRGEGRFIDLQLDFCDQEKGDVLARLGGVWDRGALNGDGDWSGEARTSMRIELHGGQLEAFDWFMSWLDDHLDRRFGDGEKAEKKKRKARKKAPQIYSAMFGGGRRGGKSYLSVACVVAYAVTIPNSICWIVCPTDLHYDEIKMYVEGFMPASWRQWRGKPHNRYLLPNGSVIYLKSAHNPNTLKKGRVDLALLNEGQQMKEIAFAHVRAAVADKGGLALVACNPPDTGDVGLWVGDFAVEAQEGVRLAKYFFFDPLDNPNIDREALMALADEVDEHTFNVQVRGMFLSPKGAVFYNWDRVKNERALPEVYDDITEAFTQRFEDAAYTNIVSIDVNRFPYIACGVWKIVKNPRFPSMKRALAYCWDEVSLDGGDEHDVCQELIDRGLDPRKTIVVMDASGWWQSFKTMGNDRTDRVAKLDAQGMSSAAIFQKYGFRVVRPDRRIDRNPGVVERCRAVCARIKTKAGDRYLFVDPRCKSIARAMQRWETKHGKPSRTSEHAHHGDGIGYFVWRYWSRRQSADSDSVSTGRSPRPSRTKKTKGLKNVF